jgi:putative protease
VQPTSPIPTATEAAKPSTSRRDSLPELLAPAGDWECARAAVENGADAIYFGLDRFNARMRAHNFTESDLPKLMRFLHLRGVKGYITFNTLVFENELSQASEYLRTMIAAGVDAAIVQDVGICRLIRQLSPDFPIHVSTQMTITSAAGVEFARDLGCNLIVLARECSIIEIEKIIAATKESDAAGPTTAPGFPIEVFVHGALCVAYSGQCLTSEALGGRSANRGECAQACRMPYDLIADGQRVDLGDRKYLLSPQDLAGKEVLPELVRAGVSSLKIEGRLKSPEYVANITRVYRQALDALAAANEDFSPTSHYEMEMAFSRGLYSGWFRGINNQELVHARFGKKRGVYLGEVLHIDHGRASVKLTGPLKRGDGVVFDSGNPQEDEEGGRIYNIEARPGGAVWLSFGDGAINWSRVHTGDKLWKTSDPELDRRLRQTFHGDSPKFRRIIDFEAHGAPGTVLTLIARDECGNIARVESREKLAAAEKQPLTTEKLRDQVTRLGGTPFKLGALANNLEGAVHLPVSELNRLRRDIVQLLESRRLQPLIWKMNQPVAAKCGARFIPSFPDGTSTSPRLLVLVRSMPQLEVAISEGIETVYCEFEDPKRYREAVQRFRGASFEGKGRAIFVAPPRIFKTGEEWTLKLVASSEPDGLLVRNYDHLKFFAGKRLVGDFSLNVANHLTADYFLDHFGLERVTASYDLNFEQLEAFLREADASRIEITIHQHMPMFHMEHCVFCAFLSEGTDYRNCGRPCDTREVRLRDRVGAEHPLKADAGCRNTVFNALAQTGADYVGRMIQLGARKLRIEFLNETPEQTLNTIRKYRQLLKGEITGQQLWRDLQLLNQLGVTRGQMAKQR